MEGGSFASLNEVLDEVGIAGGIPNVDGMTGNGGRESSVGGEIAALYD